MTPTERRRPVTRRRRLAHLGVGGVIVAAASAHLATISGPEPVAHAAELTPPADFPMDLPPKPKLVLPRPEPTRASRSAPRPEIIPPDWQAVAQCESGGDWRLVGTGNGFYFALQFTLGTFDAYRGDLPTAESFVASRSAPTATEQIAVADRVRAAQGWGAWPVCSQRARLR